MVWALVASYVAAFVLSGSAVFVSLSAAERATGRTVAENSQKWCELLTTLDEAYNAMPQSRPQTELGKRVAASIHQLRVDFNCPK